MQEDRQILVSGVKPTGRPHIGNYFGAMRQFVDLQDKYEAFIFIADMHALTTLHNPEELSQNILDVATDYLAIGLDPKKIVLFKQSDISVHTELAFIFESITTMPYLMRSHVFKDAEAKNKEISVGTFNYPMLMAADILLYDADAVPIGQDQKQHLEITRDTAEKFNRLFGETFKLPKPLILEDVAVVPGIDRRKMSKSYGNTIGLFAERLEIEKKVMSIPTDSKGVDEPKDARKCNVFALHKLFALPEDLNGLKERYEKGKIGYKESKEMLINNIDRFITPLREKRVNIARDKEKIFKILKEGGEVAKEIAEAKMKEVRKKIGVTIR